MTGNILTYNIVETLNNSVNEEKFNFELKTSGLSIPASAYLFGQELFIRFDSIIGESDILILNTVVTSHDGRVAEVTQLKVSERELQIRELVQMSFYHPLLDNISTTEYLTSIDNYINAFIRSGDNSILVKKLISDGENANHPSYSYLNTIINEMGNKTYEYFISKVV